MRGTQLPASPIGSTQPMTDVIDEMRVEFVAHRARDFSAAAARFSVETSCSDPSALPRPRGVRT